MAELVKKEHRYICNEGYIKEHSIDDLSECIVVHNRKQALKIFANINRIFDDYLSKAGLEGIEYYRQYFEISVRRDRIPQVFLSYSWESKEYQMKEEALLMLSDFQTIINQVDLNE